MEVKKVKVELEFDIAMKKDTTTANMPNEEMAEWFEKWLAEQFKEMSNIDNVTVKAAITDKE